MGGGMNTFCAFEPFKSFITGAGFESQTENQSIRLQHSALGLDASQTIND